MRRQLKDLLHGWKIGNCCPGHDTFPCETYRSRRSKRARARDKKVEHQYARTILKRQLRAELNVDQFAMI